MRAKSIDLRSAKFTQLRGLGREIIAPGARIAIVTPALVITQPDMTGELWQFMVIQPDQDSEGGYGATELVLGKAKHEAPASVRAVDAVLAGGITYATALAKRDQIMAGIDHRVNLIICKTEDDGLRALVQHFGCDRARALLKESVH